MENGLLEFTQVLNTKPQRHLLSRKKMMSILLSKILKNYLRCLVAQHRQEISLTFNHMSKTADLPEYSIMVFDSIEHRAIN